MAVRVAVEHRTTYRFDRPTALGPHVVRLRPAPHCRTPVTAYSLKVSPAGHYVNWQQDVHGNHLARLVFPEPATELTITVGLVADLTVINPFDFFVDASAETFPFSYAPELAHDLEPYLRTVTEPGYPEGSGAGPRLRGWLQRLHPEEAKGTPIVDFLVEVNRRVAQEIGYSVRLEEGFQSPDVTLHRGIGSCRDSAWLLVCALRELGLAARFVSGYLIQLVPDGQAASSPPGLRDFTDLHAWAEVYIPGAGWVGLDATSGLLAGEGHIPLVGTPWPESAAAITGTTGPTVATMEFSNTVRRLRSDPRVTAPYTAGQVAAVHALGAAVDAALEAGDVRLTMGGEPTFVATGDPDAVEGGERQWRTDADGPHKRRLAADLAATLRAHYAPGGIMHHGQGKWYPGEPLPRWQIAIVWRADGEALWGDPHLLDDPWGPPVVTPGAPATQALLAELTAAIATGLGIPPDYARPLYEDPLDRLATEARLPTGVPPRDPATTGALWRADAEARARIVAELDADRGEPVGWALPVARAEDTASENGADNGDERAENSAGEPPDKRAQDSLEGWTTTEWTLRRGWVFLRPGTSPAGLRLPLDAVAWTPPPDTFDRSGFLARPDLARPGTSAEARGTSAEADGPPPAIVLPVEAAPTTALCVEERGGHVFVFLPPLPAAECAVELLGVLERAVRGLGARVVLEGYLPAADPRLRTLTVTPDPGVVEVNVQPAASWPELVELNRTLDAAARAAGLATETFALDGTHAGTGGGNHLTLGGRTPADSPLLRRPDLLVSMLTFWQHHPALSYLFSGRFIGPTSQSPRVDEGRHETLYELEIAFAELARLASAEPAGARPWQVDRALRHLLTDITGNTHRSEFCIDKLFSPDSERGRLGLLEMRGFEMPPHPDMALVQALLLRALVARFWAQPYAGPLVRWGTHLHDRFLLPDDVLADAADVVADLNRHGFAFDAAWLAPFGEFRFPRLGSVEVAGVHVELRAAIEPWHVLGEEVTGGGTARYVDSSLERLQVKVTGGVAGRHVLTCNGVPVPLFPARTDGPGADAQVAGIRYRAWQPYSALHPTIGVHSPLVFDVVDAWSALSLGGCTYHVVHPGGLAYHTSPVNAGEAEARRATRFAAEGHTPGPVDVSAWQASPMPGPFTPPSGSLPSGEYPRTLDLRRATRR